VIGIASTLDLWRKYAKLTDNEAQSRYHHTIAGLLLTFFSRLTIPLLETYTDIGADLNEKYEAWLQVAEMPYDPSNPVTLTQGEQRGVFAQNIRKLTRRLPELEHVALEHIILLLHRLSLKEKAQMSAARLAVIWAPPLLRPEGFTWSILKDQERAVNAVKLVIKDFSTIFSMAVPPVIQHGHHQTELAVAQHDAGEEEGGGKERVDEAFPILQEPGQPVMKINWKQPLTAVVPPGVSSLVQEKRTSARMQRHDVRACLICQYCTGKAHNASWGAMRQWDEPVPDRSSESFLHGPGSWEWINDKCRNPQDEVPGLTQLVHRSEFDLQDNGEKTWHKTIQD